MTKYTDDFKRKVVMHYLKGHGYRKTAQIFELNCTQVRSWIKLYQTHGIKGIRTKHCKRTYSVEFKHQTVLQVLAGKSRQSLAIELNIHHSILTQWVKLYRQHGIIGLYPKPKGKTAMRKRQQPPKFNKPDEQKTQAELIAELQYVRMERDILKKLAALDHQQKPLPKK